MLSESIICAFIIFYLMCQRTVKASCEEPEDKIELTFDLRGKMSKNILHTEKNVFTTFGNINYFVNTDLDFKILSSIEQDELYSVIMVKQTTYPRLEPDGDIRLKWFVANVPGSNLTLGKSLWQGITLAEFEPILPESPLSSKEDDDLQSDIKNFHLLWIFKHVDRYTHLEQPVDEYERDNFAVQIYYDFICSKPVVEVAFIKNNQIDQAKVLINMAKRINN